MADFPSRIDVIDPDEYEHDTGLPEFHSVMTISLGELIDCGVFTWERVDWKDAAYSPEQYARLCAAFEARYYYRDISIIPVKAWLKRLHYEIVYNLMPKYRPLYAQLDSGDFDPLQTGGEYRKERRIDSDFPETLLSGNQDYASSGYDFEREMIGRGNLADDLSNYVDKVHGVDDMMIRELGKLFSSLWTTNVNGW